MAISTPPAGLGSIQLITDDAELLLALKELKNSIIGNTWKKVEVADDEGLLQFLLARTEFDHNDESQIHSVIAGEIAVIIGAIASEGSLTIRQLLRAEAAEYLLQIIRRAAGIPLPNTEQLAISALRALRNVLVSTADMTWGSAWGIGTERHVIGTGLVGPEIYAGEGSRRSVPTQNGQTGASEGRRVLGLIFEPTHMNALLSMLYTSSSPQVALPVYQIFARLVSQPSHRQTLTSWKPAPSTKTISTATSNTLVPENHLLQHLTEVIVSTKSNAKVLEAALDLLASLIKDEGSLANDLCFDYKDDSDPRALRKAMSTIKDIPLVPANIRGSNLPKILHLFETGQTPVQIAAAGCLTSIYRAQPKSAKLELGANIVNHLLEGIVKLMSNRVHEDRTKLCFILATLVTDDATLQMLAASLGFPSLLQEILHHIEQDVKDGPLSPDTAARGREAAFLAMTALASNLETTRIGLADGTRPTLAYLREAVVDPSYGVRAGACQFVRVLSRTVALVRTTLMDAGVASAVVCMFANYVPSRLEEITANKLAAEWRDGGESWPDRDYVVEITALAALCNLVADCMPLKQILLSTAALPNICHLVNCPSETIVVNALWALSNATFKSSESDKRKIVEAIGVRTLMKLASQTAPAAVNVRAFALIQNYLADATLAELSNAVETLGEEQLFAAIQSGLRPGVSTDLRVAALGMLVNLCYGNEKLRLTIVGHRWIILALVEAMDSPFDEVKVHALKAIRNLITSTTKRPRLLILAPFRPYCIGPRVKKLADTSPDLDVATIAIALNEVLEKVRPGQEVIGDDPLDR